MQRIVLAVMALITGFSSMAQTANLPSADQKKFHKNHKYENKQNIGKLDLTDDQKAQIKTLNQNFRQQMQDLNKNKSITADELKEKRHSIVKEHKEKIKAILTPGQRKEAKEMKDDFAKEGENKMEGKRFEEMTKDLNLTPEQSTKMKDLNTALTNNIQSIRQNTSLDREEKKEQMKSLMRKHKDDMETLLTNEQKEQLKNNRKNRRSEAVR